MKVVAKLALQDQDDNYLLLQLNNHPVFGYSGDLPGGTADEGEDPVDTMIREVFEEVGIHIASTDVQEVYSGTDYSRHGTHYTLFTAKLDQRPEITLSWEHAAYDWLPFSEFRKKAEAAVDTFMHMVATELGGREEGKR